MSWEKWFSENSAEFSGSIQWDQPLAPFTYYRIGGPARLLCTPRSLDDLVWISQGLQRSGAPYLIMGAGSNLLIADHGIPAVVIRLNRLSTQIRDPHLESENVEIGSSVLASTVLSRAMQQGWGGFEFMAGIPGSIGGMVRMNAGTRLGEVKDFLKEIRVFDLLTAKSRRADAASFSFSYRKNHALLPHEVVVDTVWKFKKTDPTFVRQAVEEALKVRKANQPVEHPSCGSVFKNPKGRSAWQVVDELGLRGHRIGNAQISEKHSNFILNLGNARAEDVSALIDLAQSRARIELGVELETEVLRIGF